MSDAGNPNDPNAAWGTPPADQPGYGAPQPGYGQRGYGAPQGGYGYGAPQPGQPGQPGAPGGPGYGAPQQWGAPPPGYAYNTAPQTDGKAIGGLVCAIGSFFVCPGILAVVALILASGAKRNIEQSGGRLGGEGMVTATKVVAWINIAFSVLFLIIFVVAITAAGHASNEYGSLARLVLR